MLQVDGVSNNLFLNSSTIQMVPAISAEWNQNLFNQPYLTVAGLGNKQTITIGADYYERPVIDDASHPVFNTYYFPTTNGSGSIGYDVVPQGFQYAYKIITYMMTDSATPVMVNSYAQGELNTQYGSTAIDINSFGWTKVETYIGSDGNTTIGDFVYKIQVNRYSSSDVSPKIYYTEPEVYATTYFDYQYGSLWPSQSPFTYFRPGESYVQSGNQKAILPTGLRSVKTKILNSQSVDSNGNVTNPPSFPMTPVIENPQFSAVSVPSPFYKNVMPSDMSAYKYFVSDVYDTSISAIYMEPISSNKIVIKLNTIMTIPTVNISIDGNMISVNSSNDITPDSNGLIVLYATKHTDNSVTWSKDKWSTMPKFNLDGTLSNYIQFSKITVTQTFATPNNAFSDYASRSFNAADDMQRMHLIEASPRLEIDLSDYAMEVSINKSLDSKNSSVPISSINTDDASITLSAIPILLSDGLVPLFSSQSNLSINVLSSMLRKNIKFYVNFNLLANFDPANGTLTNVNKYIPGGVYYSDVWDETDVKTVKIQCYDATRYLQTMPVPDYVANLKSVFDIITNILDLAGYTDYDYDSLYKVCKNASSPMDLAYYYCNSKDTTIYDALAQIFLANQIGAYIDEYNIMRFLSLSQILSNKTSQLTLDDAQIIEGGYQISNKAKPGKISVRYQSPKIKQSPAIQNAYSFAAKVDGSFIYTTANDVVWTQQNIDSVGFNHLSESFSKEKNRYKININDLLNIFHTFSLSNDGYASIENEIVSFLYKEYTISDNHGSTPVTVSVKNDLELQSEINRYVKQNESGLALSLIDNEGNPVLPNANVTVTPTGYITNVQRGLFGTPCVDHNIITSLTQKGLKEATLSSVFALTANANGTNTKVVTNKVNDVKLNSNVPQVSEIQIAAKANKKTIIYPNEKDQGYKTYSAKFDMHDYEVPSVGSAGIFFNAQADSNSFENSYFVELVKFGQSVTSPTYKFLLVISQVVGGVSKVIAFSDVTSIAYSVIASFEKILYQAPNTSSTVTQQSVDKLVFDKNNNRMMDQLDMLLVYGISKGMYVQGHGIAENTKVSSISGNRITLDKLVSSSTKVDDILTFSPYTYQTTSDQTFNLKINHYYSDPTTKNNGEDDGELIEVFINNIEILGWQVPSVVDAASRYELYYGWKSTGRNKITGLRKKVVIKPNSALDTSSTNFGFFMSTSPTPVATTVVAYNNSFLESTQHPIFTYPSSTDKIVGNLREIYASEKLLNERSVNYWFQDREFLNGLVQGQNIFSKYKTYMMQTNPEVLGINYYDVQYTTPAAVSVDVLPVEYLWYYFPGNETQDQKFYQTQLVDEYSLAYSTPINTGFRAKMAIANNSSHMVYLKKDSDSLNQFTINLNLWTHEIVAQSDPQIIEKIIDQSNIAEVIQLDSQWIQSKDAANKLLATVEKGIEGFSKDTSIQIFGNPLVQVGDVLTLTYKLAGLKQQKYIVHSVSQTFNQGLKTTLVLNMLDKGITY
jgi:hypothetical protein